MEQNATGPSPISDLWYGTDGPRDAKIVLVGEAWGEQESVAKKPFVGSSGYELNRMLAEAGIQRSEILCTNVAAIKPFRNEMWRLFHHPKDARTSLRHLHPGQFLRSELERLFRQINSYPRQLVIVAGNYSLWALTSVCGYDGKSESEGIRVPTGIMNWRGSMWQMLPNYLHEAPQKYSDKGTPVLPIIHPAAIMRQWSLRAVTVHDLKARVPLALSGDWRPNPHPIIWAPPTFEQATSRLRLWLNHADAGNEVHLACDIETIRRQLITCVGFSDSENFAMSIPFVKKTGAKGVDSYWTIEQEASISKLIRSVLLHPRIFIEGQNFIYDTQYFQHWLGVTPRLNFDTMLAHHLLFPGTPKGLDYLSSLYCRYHWYWKEDGKDWETVQGTLEDHLTYNAWDCLRTREAAESLRELIVLLKQEKQWEFIKERNAFCLRMMNRGVRIDQKARSRMAMDLGVAHSAIKAEIDSIITSDLLELLPQNKTKVKKHVDWWDSSKKAQALFYDIFGVKPIINRKTKRPTLGKDAISEIPKRAPEWTNLVKKVQKIRSVQVFNSHFIRAPLDTDGRIRCSFNPAGTETHRLSSSANAFGGGTNLQNIPKGEED